MAQGGESGPGSPEAALAASIVRVAGRDGDVGGVGFLVSDNRILTCAHVVSDALGLPRDALPPPGATVVADLPLAGAGMSVAEVEHWVPEREDRTGDVAVLRLRAAIPGAAPLGMADPAEVWGHRVRIAGFTGRFPGGVWHAGRLRGGTAESWVQLSGADTHGVPVERGFSGSPVWDEDARAVVGIVVAGQLTGTRQSFLIPTRTLVAEIPALADILLPPSPFRGLAAFQESDSAVYFGRDDEVDDVCALLTADQPRVVLVGPSGCGKSSLALAGVAPRLRERGHEVLVLRPVDSLLSPRAALAAELVRAAHPDLPDPDRAAYVDRYGTSLRDHGMTDTARLALGERADRLLVVLDQAEELLAAGEDAAAEVAELLLGDPAPAGVRVLITLRADFLRPALDHPVLGPALNRSTARPLAPMSREQLAAVVLKPVEAIPAVSYDPGLVQQILDDAAAEPGALPLLGFVLEQLWAEQAAGRLRFTTYEEIGGVKGALRRHAENAWAVCVPEADRGEALRLLTSLVTLLPGGEAPLRRSLSRAEAGEAGWRIARALAKQRILVLGGDAEHGQSIELAHEALIGAWPVLSRQVSENRGFLVWRTALHRDIERWREAGGDEEQLLSGGPLDEAETQLRARPEDVSAEARRFIEASLRRRADRRAKERRDTRVKRAGITLLALLLAVVGLVALLLDHRNGQLDDELRRAASPQLASRAAQLDDVSLSTSALFSAAAYRTSPTPEARTALLEQYLRLRNVERVALEGRGEVTGLSSSEDGRRLTVGLADGRILGLDLREKSPAARQLLKSSNTRRVATSPDGRIAARASNRGQVSLGVLTGKGTERRSVVLREVTVASENARAATDLRFDPAGRRVLAAIPREGVLVWEAGSGRRTGPTLRAPDGWDVDQAWFGPADTVVARIVGRTEGGRAAAGRLVRWHLGDARPDTGPWGAQETGFVTVSGDGHTLVRCTPDGVLEAWELAGEPKPRYRYGTGLLRQLCPLYVPRLDRTGRYLINPVQRFGARLGRFRFLVLDLERGYTATVDLPSPTQRDEALTGPGAPIGLTLTGPPENMRAAVGVGGTVLVAKIPRPSAFDHLMITSRIRTVDADHGRVISIDADGGVLRLWDLRTRRQLGVARPSVPLDRLYPAVTPDGRHLLTATADRRAVLVWSLTGPSGAPGLSEVRRLDLPGPPGVDPAVRDERTGLTSAWVNISFNDADHAVISASSYVVRWEVSTGRQTGRAYRPPVQAPVDVASAVASVFGTARPGHPQAVVRTDDKIVLWDFDKGETVATATSELGGVKQLGFERTGRTLAVLSYGGAVQLWDADREKWARKITYQGAHWLGAFSSLSALTTQDVTNAFVMWDARSGKERFHFTPGYGATADLSDDGGWMGYIDGSDARLLPLRPEAWNDHVCRVAGRGLSDAEKKLTPAGSRTQVCG
ncbi:trypsin-like peptidase domain-containing protein [Streptomyces sp. NPDC020403]|uniref:nSTAND1 domain-containing NTPase n=1 Tax=unclassified Streptomyces TaxID=2593676 RepID=UPI0033F55064